MNKKVGEFNDFFSTVVDVIVGYDFCVFFPSSERAQRIQQTKKKKKQQLIQNQNCSHLATDVGLVVGSVVMCMNCLCFYDFRIILNIFF